MSEDNLTSIILETAVSAANEYHDMTLGDCCLEHTPEYWYTTKIGLGIKKRKPNYSVILETPMAEFRAYSKARLGRPAKAYRKSGKADISLWKQKHEEWIPRCIIEVKKAWGWKKILEDDIGRILSCMLEGQNVDLGYLVIMTDSCGETKKLAENKLQTRLAYKNGLSAKINQCIKDRPITVSFRSNYSDYDEETESVIAALVFEFKAKEEKN